MVGEMAPSSELSSETSTPMRSPLSSFMRSPISSSMMPSPVSSRLTMEFETAFMMEAEEPIRFSGTDILPYLSQSSSRSTSSDFDTQSGESGSTSFCDLNDSNRITLASLIGLPMAESFRNFGESLRFMARGDSHYDSGSNRTMDMPPRRSRTCSLFSEVFRCLQRSKADYVNNAPVARNLTNLASFTITEVSEEEERDSDNDVGPTVFENSVFVDRDTLGSRIYEFNPLYISDAMSEVDPAEARDLSFSGEILVSGGEESQEPRSKSEIHRFSSIRAVLTTICCRLGDECPSD